VIPGARTIEQLKANVGAVDGDVTADELARVASLHQQWRSEGRW
jgi:aryl-alcohol dehydrogenase-like predicted oxidoreductase